MNVRALSVMCGLVLVAIIAPTVAHGSSPATTTLYPNVAFKVTIEVNSLDFINYSWSVSPTANVLFVITQPDGSIIWQYNGSSYDFFIVAGTSGTYSFNWTNTGSTSVTLTYDVSRTTNGMQPTEHALDIVLILVAVGAIAVVVIIVLVVFVAMKGETKLPHQFGPSQQHAPPGESPAPYVPGMCPRCGSHIDSKHVVCPKCGARVR